MTVSPAKQAQQIRAASFGPQLVSPSQIPPTGSTTLWTVAGGSISITSVQVVVTATMSATATTLNIGCNITGSPSATALLSAGTLTSLAAGASVSGIPVLTSGGLGSVIATAGAITWIASATQTGTCQVYLSFIPLDVGATVG